MISTNQHDCFQHFVTISHRTTKH